MTFLELWYKDKAIYDFWAQINYLNHVSPSLYSKLMKSPEWLAKDFEKVEAKMYEEVGLMICKRAIKNI